MSSISQAGVNRVPTDSGTAIPVGGALTLVGAGGITTSAVGSTVTITGGGGGGGITTIDGDTGSATGAAVTFTASTSAGGSLNFSAAGATVTLDVTDSGLNTFLGENSGNTTSVGLGGSSNSGYGYASLNAITTGASNCAFGVQALQLATDATGNCAFGSGSLSAVVSAANFNSCFGFNSGKNYTGTEDGNIIIGNTFGTVGESRTTRIGNIDSTGAQQACFIEGIANVSVSNTEMVTIDSTTGQMGSQAIPTGLTWSVITADQSALVNHGYICNKAGTLALALPVVSAVGDVIEVTGINTALGWQITQVLGQQIFYGEVSTTSGAGGTLTSSATRDSLRMVCIAANTTWQVLSSIGNITYV